MAARELSRSPKGPEKAAILMLSLSDAQAGKIMTKLEDYEIRELSQVMASLGKVDSDMVEKVFIEFAEKVYSGGELVGNFESTERTLMKLLDPERVDAIMEEIRGPAGRTMWDKLGNVSEETLASFLKNEYPQTIAVVLSKIRTSHAGKVITLLPEDLSMEVMLRMLKMEAVQKEVLADVEHTLKTEFMSNLSRTTTKNPYEILAEVFNSFDRTTEERLMEGLEKRNPEAAEKIKSLMFTFDDLVKLDATGVQTVIKVVDKSVLAMALKGAKQELKDLFFNNMSERAAKLLKEDIESLGMVKIKQVDEAQQQIVVTTKDMAMRGEIIIPEDSEDEEMIY